MRQPAGRRWINSCGLAHWPGMRRAIVTGAGGSFIECILRCSSRHILTEAVAAAGLARSSLAPLRLAPTHKPTIAKGLHASVRAPIPRRTPKAPKVLLRQRLATCIFLGGDRLLAHGNRLAILREKLCDQRPEVYIARIASSPLHQIRCDFPRLSTPGQGHGVKDGKQVVTRLEAMLYCQVDKELQETHAIKIIRVARHTER